ncbi:MAG: carbohydrate kinase, partial [Clostridia bacterium]|nr:carbohydrate kinase [Clostridia bacterium]
MKTLYAIGEALIDFIPSSAETPLEAVEAFCPKVGGAPANVAVIYALLGGKSRMLTAVGKDAFGRKIQQTLAACGVDTAYIAEKS